ncbi:hypothetical protein SD70_22080 [Gordoniibacillus kamchatkensis]|uniref:ROK family protein n=1 Tax=Gordoniibacillus kamchatkensis TaxID=1590651 RepID=A0ABR5ADP4_9BACL|nr:ROK family protein [Paenibacillus sp. VKM B-2647]KIL39122.1 hypothetical protein SD70_22080 [Paenibacillus sp. VKM B-2647]
MKRDLYDPQSSYAIGVDIGGTKINTGVINRQGEVLCSFSLPTLAGQANVIDRVTEAIEELLAKLKVVTSLETLKGIGVGTAGQVDWQTGTIRFASDLLPGYTGTPLRAILQNRFRLPAYVDNDVNALALTEKVLGAGREAKHFICLALGTGVGGVIVADGKIVHGAWGGAGEIGHMSVNYKGLPCICGNIGCLEQYASGTGIAKQMNARLAAEPGSVHQSIDAKEVIARWLSGDPLASEVIDETVGALGAAIASLIHMFNPEMIVLGGGVAEAGEPLMLRLKQEVEKRAMPSLREGVRLELAYRGNLSGMIGAGLQVWEYEQQEATG